MAGYTPNDKGIYTIPLVDLGHRLKDNFKLTIREHPEFDPVDNVHSDNSYHYIPGGGAIDIQDRRPDIIDGVGYVDRTKNLRDLLKGAGAEVIGPGDLKGHDEHLHLAGFDGGKNIRLNADQYNYFFGGNSGGKNSTFAFTRDTDQSTPSSVADPTVSPANYADMNASQINAAYDKIRMAGDIFKAQDEGLKMHKSYFKK